MRSERFLRLGCCALLLTILGCQQRLSVEKSVALEPGDVKGPVLVDGPKSEQKIKVEFTSAECPINVYVVLGKNADPILTALGSEPPKGIEVVAKKEKSKGDTFDATIPAGKDYGVYLTGATKRTQVALKVKTP